MHGTREPVRSCAETPVGGPRDPNMQHAGPGVEAGLGTLDIPPDRR